MTQSTALKVKGSILAVKSVIEAVREAITEEMSRDSKVFVMGEDVGVRGGVFLATQGLSEEFGNNRIIDAPLAEASIMGIALGAAFRGMRPIPEVQFSDFVWPSINQLIGEAARTCYGTNGAVQVPMVIRMPYGGGIRGIVPLSKRRDSFFPHPWTESYSARYTLRRQRLTKISYPG